MGYRETVLYTQSQGPPGGHQVNRETVLYTQSQGPPGGHQVNRETILYTQSQGPSGGHQVIIIQLHSARLCYTLHYTVSGLSYWHLYT